MFLRKVRRKFFNSLWCKSLNIRERRSFDLEHLISEIKSEESGNPNSSPGCIVHYDDTSLLNGTDGTLDFGGDLNGDLWRNFQKIMDSFPESKHTLYFVPRPGYKDFSDFSHFPFNSKHNLIDHPNHPAIKKLQSLETQGNVEVCLHGLRHVRNWPFDLFSAFEYEFKDQIKIHEMITTGFDDLSSCFEVHGFKPPAWSCGQLNGKYELENYLQKQGHDFFQHVSLSSPSNGLNYEKQQVSHIYPELIADNLINIPQNISILWELEDIYRIIDLIISKKGLITIQLHFCMSHKTLRDGLCDHNTDKLLQILEYVKNKGVPFLRNRDAASRCLRW